MLNEDKTSVEDLLNVLTSKDLKRGASNIYIGCETLEFSYIVKKLELSFSNLKPTSIDSSNLFFSKKGIEIKKSSLYNANHRETFKKQILTIYLTNCKQKQLDVLDIRVIN